MALTNLADTYYKPEYEDFRTSLSDADTLDTTLQSVQDTVQEVSLQFSAAKSLLDELKGEFTGELYGSVASLIDEIDAAYYLISQGLAPTIAGMKTLSSDLESLKTEDENYQTEKTNYSEMNPFKEWKEAEKATEEYSRWKTNIKSIELDLLKLIKLCKQLQQSCDDNIELVDEFNSVVVDLRLKLVALVVAQGDTTIADVQNMSLEEKEAYLQDLLDKLKAGYESSREAYTNAIGNLFGADYKDFKRTCQFLNIIFPVGTEEGDRIAMIMNGQVGPYTLAGLKSSDQGIITYGLALVDFVEWYNTAEFNGVKVSDMIDAYMGGASIEDSGLFELYKNNCYAVGGEGTYMDVDDEGFKSNFYRDVSGKFDSEDSLREKFAVGMDAIKQASTDFNTNYTDHVAKGLMYKAVSGLKDELQFDDIRQNDPAYKDFVYDIEYYEGSLPLSVHEGSIPAEQAKVIKFLGEARNDNIDLTDNERKMIGYLYSTGQYEKAATYVDVIQNGVNRRSGEIRAEKAYNSWLEGSNEGLDFVWDNARAWGKGVVHGGYDYFDSFSNIIDPDEVPSSTDYEIMRMQQLLSQPVYKVGDRYYSEGQINDSLLAQGYIPCGDTPKDGYVNMSGKLFGFQYENADIVPVDTLWDESTKTSYGSGFKVVEKSIGALTKAANPVLGTLVSTAHDFGQAREDAAQTAFIQNADMSSSELNDGVDQKAFWMKQTPQLVKAAISMGGEFSEDIGFIDKAISQTETVLGAPKVIDGVYNSLSGDADASALEIFYDIYRSYDKVASLGKKITGGGFDSTTQGLINNGLTGRWGKDSKIAKTTNTVYGGLTDYLVPYSDAYSS